MKVAINKKYKYITLETNNKSDLVFEDWVMQSKFETHSIVNIEEDINIDNLRFKQFDYEELREKFIFNIDKYNAYLIELNNPKPTETEILQAKISELEETINTIFGGV